MGKKMTPAAIIGRGHDLGYSDIHATPDGSIEWGEPLYHTNIAWERSVKRNLDAVVKYLRAEERTRKMESAEKAEKRVQMDDDLLRLRALLREMGEVLNRMEKKS